MDYRHIGDSEASRAPNSGILHIKIEGMDKPIRYGDENFVIAPITQGMKPKDIEVGKNVAIPHYKCVRLVEDFYFLPTTLQAARDPSLADLIVKFEGYPPMGYADYFPHANLAAFQRPMQLHA